jgi:hypothetical protein
METKIIKTMTNQMAQCGVTQGYLEIRGLKYVVSNINNLELSLKFERNITIILRYNEGRDLYEAEVFKGFNSIYKEEGIFCEDWKNVFERIFLKIGGLE